MIRDDKIIIALHHGSAGAHVADWTQSTRRDATTRHNTNITKHSALSNSRLASRRVVPLSSFPTSTPKMLCSQSSYSRYMPSRRPLALLALPLPHSSMTFHQFRPPRPANKDPFHYLNPVGCHLTLSYFRHPLHPPSVRLALLPAYLGPGRQSRALLEIGRASCRERV